MEFVSVARVFMTLAITRFQSSWISRMICFSNRSMVGNFLLNPCFLCDARSQARIVPNILWGVLWSMLNDRFGLGLNSLTIWPKTEKCFVCSAIVAMEANAPGRRATELLIFFVQQDRPGIGNGRCLALVYRLSRQEIPNLGKCGENIKKTDATKPL